MLDGVKLSADACGLAELEQCQAQLVLIGIEAAGPYHQTLAAYLSGRQDVVVRLVNPAAVAAIRKSQLKPCPAPAATPTTLKSPG